MRARHDIEIVIASGDLDTLQLVKGKHIQVYTLRKGLNDTVLYDEDAVSERFGFGPEHVVDYKALRGDPSDNIPGVRGIGEKTATELIQTFGSLEEIYRVLESNPALLKERGVKARTTELLKKGKADAIFSKELASIRADVPIAFALPKRRWQLSEYTDRITALCDEYEFRALKARIGRAE